MPRALAGGSGPTDWNEALDIISFGSPEQVFNLPCQVLIFVFFLFFIELIHILQCIHSLISQCFLALMRINAAVFLDKYKVI